MREKAEEYLEYFDFESTMSGMRICLAEGAPQPLLDLVATICGVHGETLLVCVYEALNCIVEADTPAICEVDEKVCPSDIMQRVLAEMEKS